jgi:hypothetical protein
MKNALIRLLALATLATSVSAFAATGDSKHNDSANTSAASQQSGCPSDSQNAKQQKKAKKEKKQQEESQQEKDFDRVLMGSRG